MSLSGWCLPTVTPMEILPSFTGQLFELNDLLATNWELVKKKYIYSSIIFLLIPKELSISHLSHLII